MIVYYFIIAAATFSGTASLQGTTSINQSAPPLTFAQEVSTWQSVLGPVAVVGQPVASFGTDTNFDGGTSGATYWNTVGYQYANTNGLSVTNNCTQEGWVSNVVWYCSQVGSGGSIKFKSITFGSSWSTRMDESESIAVTGSPGLRTNVLSHPIYFRVGEQYGVWLSGDATPANRVQIGGTFIPGSVSNTFYYPGDMVQAGTTNPIDNYCLNWAGYMARPFCIGTGDSVMEGSGNGWLSYMHIGNYNQPIGPYWVLSDQYDTIQKWWHDFYGTNNGLWLALQNMARASQNAPWAATSGVPEAMRRQPRVLYVHIGINDVNTHSTWLSVSNAYNQMLTNAVNNVTTMVVDDIWPDSTMTDNDCATNRLWNTYLSNWCTLNNVIWIPQHDQFGQTRVSTGFLDDPIGEPFGVVTGGTYWKDHLHPNTNGARFWTQTMRTILEADGALSKKVNHTP